MTSAGLTVTTVASLRDLDAGEWDRLRSGAGLYGSYGWLRAQEGDPHADVTYLVARDGAGGLVGALPCASVRREHNGFYRLDLVLGPGPGLPAPGELMVLGGRRGYRADALLAAGLPAPEREAVLRGLLGAARTAAVEAGRLPVLMYVPEGSAGNLRRAGASEGAPLNADATIALPGGDEAGWRRSLPPRRRREVEREVRRFAGAGWTVAPERLEGFLGEAGRLLALSQRRHGHAATADAMAALLAGQQRLLADRATCLVARRQGRPGGFVLAYRHGDTLFVRAAGFDYGLLGGGEYFNVVLYEPVRHAYSLGLRHVHLGIESLEAKARRGGAVTVLWCLPVGWELPAATRSAARASLAARLARELGPAGAPSLAPAAGEAAP